MIDKSVFSKESIVPPIECVVVVVLHTIARRERAIVQAVEVDVGMVLAQRLLQKGYVVLERVVVLLQELNVPAWVPPLGRRVLTDADYSTGVSNVDNSKRVK